MGASAEDRKDVSAGATGNRLLSGEEYLYFVDRAFDGMCAILSELGDDLANDRPGLPGANTAYAVLAHCVGVVEYWAGGLVAGRHVERVRESEFLAAGPVGPLLARVAAARRRLATDVAAAQPSAELRQAPDPTFLGPDRALSQGAALLHVLEELAQHHGQLQVMRDVLQVVTAVDQ